MTEPGKLRPRTPASSRQRGMSSLAGALLALCAVAAVALVVLPESPLSLAGWDSGTRTSIRTDSDADFSRLDGHWKARFSAGRVRLRLEISQPGIRWEFSSTLRESELDRGPDGAYSLRRDAGSFLLSGLEELSGSSSGELRFVPDPRFADELTALGHERVGPAIQFRLTVADVELEFIESLTRSVPEIDLDQILRLANHGIDREYVLELADAGYAGLSTEEILRLRNHGVPPEYLEGIAASGHQDASIEEIIRLRNHGVGADYVRGLHDAGLGDLSVEQMIRLRSHGVGAGYVREVLAAAERTYDTEELIRLRTRGVNGEFIRRMHRQGQQDLSVESLIRLRERGGLAQQIY